MRKMKEGNVLEVPQNTFIHILLASCHSNGHIQLERRLGNTVL